MSEQHEEVVIAEKHAPAASAAPVVAEQGGPLTTISEGRSDDSGHASGHAHLHTGCSPWSMQVVNGPAHKYDFTSTGSADLDKYFQSTVPYLRGELAPATLVDRLGPSASGTKRLHIYPWIVLNDNRNTLAKLFAPVRVAIERHKLGLWDKMMNEFQRLHPPTNWRIYRSGAPMYEFVKAWRESHSDFPEYIEQIVDCVYTRGLATNAAPVDDPAQWIDKTIFVRQYTHTVPQFIVKVTDEPDAPSPEPQSTVVLMYRSLITLRGRMFYPAIVSLLALARRTGTSPELREQFTKISDEQIDAGDDTLVEHGVLPPRTP